MSELSPSAHDSTQHNDLDPKLLRAYALIGKGLSHPARLMLLTALSQGTQSVETLSQSLDLPIANVSQHLQVLKHAGLVSDTRQGTHRLYQLTAPAVLQLLQSLKATAATCRDETARLLEPPQEFASWQSLEQARRELEQGRLTLLDIRGEEDFARGHVPGARSAPFELLPDLLAELPARQPVSVYCYTGHCRGMVQSLELLADAGFEVRYGPYGYADWSLNGPDQT